MEPKFHQSCTRIRDTILDPNLCYVLWVCDEVLTLVCLLNTEKLRIGPKAGHFLLWPRSRAGIFEKIRGRREDREVPLSLTPLRHTPDR